MNHIKTLSNPSFTQFPHSDIERSIHERFESVAKEHPDQAAIQTPSETLTYEQLDTQSSNLADNLLYQQGAKEEAIAILLGGQTAFYIGALAILKAGKFYVPLDPTFPEERNAYILNDAQADVILVNNEYLDLAHQIAPKNCRILNIDSLTPPPLTKEIRPSVSANSPAYIIYTSGSTGKPKGVLQKHKNVLHNCMFQSNAYQLSYLDRLSQLHSNSVMGAVRATYNALLNGATLCPFDIKANGFTALYDWMITMRISIYHSTSSLFRHFAQSLTNKSRLPYVRLVIVGGEAATVQDFNLFKQFFPDNSYFCTGLGSTETCTVRMLLLDKNSKPTAHNNILPLGYAVDGINIRVVNEEDTEVSAGEIGEITVVSQFLAPGYWNNKEATKKTFSTLDNGNHIYRMGDLGRILDDGCLIHAGRKDFQVKIRGFRVEISEVEAILTRHPSINQAIVLASRTPTEEKSLTAYFVLNKEHTLPTRKLRQFIKRHLPDYMVPSSFVELNNIPLTESGKIDRLALPEPKQPKLEKETTLITNDLEKSLLSIWVQLFQIKTISIHDNFFDLGGNSLLFIQLATLIEKKLAISFPVNALLQGHTIVEQATYIKSITKKQASSQKIRLKMPTEDIKRLLTTANGINEQQHSLHPLVFPHNTHLTTTPLFLVSGGKYFASFLDDRPYYDLFSGFNVIKLNPKNITALVNYYVDAILKINPNGPYIIGGYCSGSIIALKIASLLLKKQKKVPLLIIIDKYIPYRYTGKIAFITFSKNIFNADISKLKNTKLLDEFYPGGYTFNTINTAHTANLDYPTSMVLAERIHTQIQHSLKNECTAPLQNVAKKTSLKITPIKQSTTQAFFTITLTNTSNTVWPPGQICIAHHWQSNLGRYILYAQNKQTINEAVHPNQQYKFTYTVNKLNESGEFILQIGILDNFGSWFKANQQIKVQLQNNKKDSSINNLEDIDSLAEQGHLTRAIHSYYQYIHKHPDNTCPVLIKLAKALRHSRGAQHALDVYIRALKSNANSEERLIIYRNIAENHLALGRYSQVITYAQKALLLNPNDFESLSYLAVAHTNQLNHSKALELLSVIFSNNTAGRKSLFSVKTFITSVNNSMGVEGLHYIQEYAETIIHQEPYKYMNYLIYSDVCLKNEQYDKAVTLLHECNQLYPYGTQGYRRLLHILVLQKKFKPALQALQKLCNLYPFSLEYHQQLLVLMKHQKKFNDIPNIEKRIASLS